MLLRIFLVARKAAGYCVGVRPEVLPAEEGAEPIGSRDSPT
jgi:hypothetical protein